MPYMHSQAIGAAARGSAQSLPAEKSKTSRAPSSLAQYTTTAAEIETKPSRVANPNTIATRPRVRAKMRPLSPEKLTIRPKSAFDLRTLNASTAITQPPSSPAARSDSPRKKDKYAPAGKLSIAGKTVGSRGLDNEALTIALETPWVVSRASPSRSSLEEYLRHPPLHIKHSSSTLALNKEPSPGFEERGIDSVLGDEDRHKGEARAGSVTPGQRLAERFLRERSVGSAARSSIDSVGMRENRGSSRTREELSPVFL